MKSLPTVGCLTYYGKSQNEEWPSQHRPDNSGNENN